MFNLQNVPPEIISSASLEIIRTIIVPLIPAFILLVLYGIFLFTKNQKILNLTQNLSFLYILLIILYGEFLFIFLVVAALFPTLATIWNTLTILVCVNITIGFLLFSISNKIS